MLLEDDWQDSEQLTYCAISIWDHWLYTRDNTNLLKHVTSLEQESRDRKFREPHKYIIDNLTIYSAIRKKHKRWLFKETRSKQELHRRLDPNYSRSKRSFMLLLPEIKAIYSYEEDDTAVMRFQDEALLSKFDAWVENSELEYVQ